MSCAFELGLLELPFTSTHFPCICSLREGGLVYSTLALVVPVTCMLFSRKRFGETHRIQTRSFLKKSVCFGFILSKYELHRTGSIVLLNPPAPHPFLLFKSKLFWITQATEWFTKRKRGTIYSNRWKAVKNIYVCLADADFWREFTYELKAREAKDENQPSGLWFRAHTFLGKNNLHFLVPDSVFVKQNY